MNPLAILDIGSKILDNFIPDPQAKAEAKQKLLEMQQSGDLKELEVQMSAIVMEAKSQDPWTSRARPSFLYVVYIIILSAIPMGILYAISPETAGNVSTGFKQWLEAIPEPMWTLFGAGYLGYAGARSFDKRTKK